MLKPTGAACNIDCHYCLYLHKQDLLAQDKHPRISDGVLSEHIRQYIEVHAGNPEVVFTWQGGEPTLMGIDFFKKVVAIQEYYRPEGMQIFNDLQTNGLLLDEAWCEFLRAHHFLVGISIDGDEALHDLHRRTNNDKPTFALVMQAIERLRVHQIPFNALCVVNRDNAHAPLQVYRFLRDVVKPRMIQFLPCVEPADFKGVAPLQWSPEYLHKASDIRYQSEGDDAMQRVTDWTVAPEDWGYFLASIWQVWLKEDFGKVFVDQFENVISQALGYGAQQCISAPICGKAVALEHNGDLYCCDHFVYDEFKLGNIMQQHEGDLVFSPKQQKFAYLKQSTLSTQCQRCDFLSLCWGDCPKNRFVKTYEGEVGLSYLCAGLKIFYGQVTGDMAAVKQRLAK